MDENVQLAADSNDMPPLDACLSGAKTGDDGAGGTQVAGPPIRERAFFDPRLRRVADHVREHISDPARLSLVEAARLANVGPEHFCRLFHGSTGRSFSEWQNGYRMEFAKELILDRWIQIGLVGRAVGYDHPATFCRVFKRYEGISPRDLRPFAARYPNLVRALRVSNARLVFRIGPWAERNSAALELLEALAQRLD